MPVNPSELDPDLIWIQDVPEKMGVSVSWLYERVEPKGPLRKRTIVGRTYLYRSEIRKAIMGDSSTQANQYQQPGL